MKRVFLLLIAGCLGAAAPLPAQNRYGLRLNGSGGFGISTSNQSSVNFTSGYRSISTELGLNASGFLYDRRLLNYNFSTFWDRNNTGIDQGSSRSTGLNYNGSVSFLPERPFPFSFYFSRNDTRIGGSLLPALNTVNTLWGLRGEIKKPKLAMINYSLGFGGTENDLPTGEVFNTRQRTFNLSATRRLAGWDLRFGEDYLRTTSSFSNFRDRTNTLSLDASRAIGSAVRTELGASHSKFSFEDLNGSNSSRTGVTLLNGSVAWRHTERLDSFYNASLSRNAVNTLLLLTRANGSSGIPLPVNTLSLNSLTQAFAAGANYRPKTSLNLSAGLSYSHSGLPPQTLAALPAATRNAATTGVLGTSLGANYFRKIWKLDFRGGASLTAQRFSLLSGTSASGLGYGLESGVSGGTVRRLQFSTSYRFHRRTNPIFFNVVETTDHRANVKLETAALGWITLQAMAEYGTTSIGLAGSDLHLNTTSYMVSATVRNLNFLYSHGASDSDERFFGPGSIFGQRGGSTGQALIPSPLLNPLIFSKVSSDRVGVVWRARRNLQLEGRYARNRYDFIFLNRVDNRYSQFDVTVQYHFGRFTILTGYGLATAEAPRYTNRLHRFYFRVRFPFRLL